MSGSEFGRLVVSHKYVKFPTYFLSWNRMFPENICGSDKIIYDIVCFTCTSWFVTFIAWLFWEDPIVTCGGPPVRVFSLTRHGFSPVTKRHQHGKSLQISESSWFSVCETSRIYGNSAQQRYHSSRVVINTNHLPCTPCTRSPYGNWSILRN
jgi:hypothetical protein